MSDKKLQEIIIDRFDGGISDDPRAPVKTQFVMSKHFDIFSSPNRLTPYRSLEADSNDGSTPTGMKAYDVRDYWFSALSGRLYGLAKNGSSQAKVVYKADGDQDAGNWTLPSSSEATAVRVAGSFIEWGTVAALWMFTGSTGISTCIPGTSFTTALANTGATIASVAQSIISPRDNNMYMFYNSSVPQAYVVRVSAGGVVTDNVLPLPVGYKITSACLTNSGEIAIGLSSTFGGGIGRSILVIWDPTLSNMSQVIDFGDGVIASVGNVEGYIVAVMNIGLTSSLAPTGGKLTVRVWGGGSVQTIKDIKATTIGSLISSQRIVKDFKLYFPASLFYNGALQHGIWAFGRKNPGAAFGITLAVADENIGVNGIQGFGSAGDYFWLSINADGTIDKIDDQANYTFTSVYESQKFNGGNASIVKDMQSIFATYAPLPAAGQVVVKYRKDEETSYTTLFTETTDNEVRTELGRGGAVTLPSFKEIQFRVESTGGAEITALGFRFFGLQSATTPN